MEERSTLDFSNIISETNTNPPRVECSINSKDYSFLPQSPFPFSFSFPGKRIISRIKMATIGKYAETDRISAYKRCNYSQRRLHGGERVTIGEDASNSSSRGLDTPTNTTTSRYLSLLSFRYITRHRLSPTSSTRFTHLPRPLYRYNYAPPRFPEESSPRASNSFNKRYDHLHPATNQRINTAEETSNSGNRESVLGPKG